ncbi:MAG: hypothetical protein ABW221_10050 [Vicinamibacteria bacterium]
MTAVLAVALLVAGGAAPSRTGTWTRDGGTLAVVEDAQGARFQLQLSRGAPSYNMGFVEGTLEIDAGRATYESPDGECTITFTFARDTVEVDQARGDDFECGFGRGVYANGTYRRTNRKKPKLDLTPK